MPPQDLGTVSIITPTFNRLHHLRTAIECVFAQTYEQWEWIIADDGSDAETREHLQTLERHANIRVLWLPHSGYPAIARNAALREAKGEYVAFLDSDDAWSPEKLGLQLASLRNRPGCLWGYCGFELVDKAGAPLSKPRETSWTPRRGWIFEQLLKMDAVISTSSVIASRRLLQEVSGFDEKLLVCEDYDLFLRLAQRSEVDTVADRLIGLRRHTEHYSADADGFIGRGQSLEKLLTGCTEDLLQSQIREELAKNSIGLATSYIGSGQRLAAVGTLLRTGPYSWRFSRWWKGALATVIRAVLPPVVQKAWQRYRLRAGGIL